MTFTPWRERTEPEAGPFDGVPDHLKRPLDHWIMNCLHDSTALRIALTMRHPFVTTSMPRAELRTYAARSADNTLTVIDLMLQDSAEHIWDSTETLNPYELEHLKDVLLRGGSLWTVNATEDGLTRRVSFELEAIRDSALESKSPASLHLRSAWNATYGLNPNPNHAYSEAVLAVEYAAGGVVAPKSKSFRLNRIAIDLHAQRSKFECALSPDEDAELNVIGLVAGLMQWLIRAQSGRHGQPTDASVEHSIVEAEMAVQIAVLLIEWFESGYIRRVDASVAE